MKLREKLVYLNMPALPERKVEISKELEIQLQQEMAKKFDKLTVFAVASTVEDIQVGDEVFVNPSEVQRATLVEIDGLKRIAVPSYAIMHIW